MEKTRQEKEDKKMEAKDKVAKKKHDKDNIKSVVSYPRPDEKGSVVRIFV